MVPFIRSFMRIAKRIFLFLAVNILVVVTMSVILNLLGVKPYLTAHGLNYTSLMIFCFVWGMGGAFISLGLSRMMAKWLMGVRLIDPNTTEPILKNLLVTVHRLAKEAGLKSLPQVGVYNSKEVNAFATGPSQSRSLVAVSRGLLEKMSEAEVEGVLAHEIAHIANGDMVTMTLLQGVVNAFVMFLARILAFALSGMGNKNKEGATGGSLLSYTLLVFLFEMVFMVLGMMIIAAYSRRREYRADQGGATLAGKDKMIAALESLMANQKIRDKRVAKPAFQSMKISGAKKKGRLVELFSTHPPLKMRIERLSQSL
jgi:heat shock protein HtpX